MNPRQYHLRKVSEIPVVVSLHGDVHLVMGVHRPVQLVLALVLSDQGKIHDQCENHDSATHAASNGAASGEEGSGTRLAWVNNAMAMV